MQTLEQIEKIADGFYDRIYDRMTDRDAISIEKEIADLTDDYMDDADMIWDTIIDTSFINHEQFLATFRAMVNAHALGNEQSMMAFAKSLSMDVMDAVQKRAEWQVTK